MDYSQETENNNLTIVDPKTREQLHLGPNPNEIIGDGPEGQEEHINDGSNSSKDTNFVECLEGDPAK